MRIRVFAGIGIAAALLGLSACRSSPTVAAYIGDQKLTEDRVTTLIDEFESWAHSQATQNGQDPAVVERPDRTQVVNFLVRSQLCDEARKKLNFQVQEPQIPPGSSELGTIVARTQACEQALPAGDPVKPTEADAQQIFDIGVANGVWPADSAQEQIPGILSSPDVAEALGRRKTLNDAVSGVNVSVNPKYGVVEVPLISFQGGIPAVSVSFGDQGPVDNRPPVQPSAPPQTQTQ